MEFQEHSDCKPGGTGHESVQQLSRYWVGQTVYLMNATQPVRNVVYNFKQNFINAYERLAKAVVA